MIFFFLYFSLLPFSLSHLFLLLHFITFLFKHFFVVTFHKFLHFIFILGSEVNRRFWVAKREGILESF